MGIENGAFRLHIPGIFTSDSRQIRDMELANIGKPMNAKVTVQKWNVSGQI